MTDLGEFDLHQQVSDLRESAKTLQRQLLKSKAKGSDFREAVQDGVREAMVILGNPPPVPKPQKDTRKKPGEIAVLHLSDWQLGKKTQSYNSEVAVQRAQILTDKVLQMVEIERGDHPVREIAVLLGGDMVEGVNIFKGQAFEIDSNTFNQSLTAALAIETMLRQFLAVFEKVHVWIEEGNHGRTGSKGELPKEDNWDLVTYEFVRRVLQDEEGLHWNPHQGWYQIVSLGNYQAVLVHGDEVKSFGGNLPAFGITRKSIAWSSGVIKEPFTDVYMGHWHNPMVLPLANGNGRVFVNPTMESDSIYAQEFVAAQSTPAQRLNFVDPDAGFVTSERLLRVDGS